jgi:hypothetical protein
VWFYLRPLRFRQDKAFRPECESQLQQNGNPKSPQTLGRQVPGTLMPASADDAVDIGLYDDLHTLSAIVRRKSSFPEGIVWKVR